MAKQGMYLPLPAADSSEQVQEASVAAEAIVSPDDRRRRKGAALACTARCWITPGAVNLDRVAAFVDDQQRAPPAEGALMRVGEGGSEQPRVGNEPRSR